MNGVKSEYWDQLKEKKIIIMMSESIIIIAIITIMYFKTKMFVAIL